MMGRQIGDQPSLFYEFRLDDRIPKGHLLRRINVFLAPVLDSMHEQLAPDALDATPTLRGAQSLSGRWPSDERCKPSQILGDGSQNELILGAPWTTQSKPFEFQDALQVCEPHLDLLPFTSRLLKAVGASERPGDVSGVLMDIARDLARWVLWTTVPVVN